jgi:hypothetical protein
MKRKDGLMDKDDPDLFPLGRKIVSKNALAVLGEAGVTPTACSSAAPQETGA